MSATPHPLPWTTGPAGSFGEWNVYDAANTPVARCRNEWAARRIVEAVEELGTVRRLLADLTLAAAADRVRRWPTAKNTQEQFAIYRDHPAGNRLGGIEYQTMMLARRQDCEMLASALLNLAARVAAAGGRGEAVANTAGGCEMCPRDGGGCPVCTPDGSDR